MMMRPLAMEIRCSLGKKRHQESEKAAIFINFFFINLGLLTNQEASANFTLIWIKKVNVIHVSN